MLPFIHSWFIQVFGSSHPKDTGPGVTEAAAHLPSILLPSCMEKGLSWMHSVFLCPCNKLDLGSRDGPWIAEVHRPQGTEMRWQRQTSPKSSRSGPSIPLSRGSGHLLCTDWQCSSLNIIKCSWCVSTLCLNPIDSSSSSSLPQSLPTTTKSTSLFLMVFYFNLLTYLYFVLLSEKLHGIWPSVSDLFHWVS